MPARSCRMQRCWLGGRSSRLFLGKAEGRSGCTNLSKKMTNEGRENLRWGTRRLSMLTQPQVPSGFEERLGCSDARARAARTAFANTCFQDGSGFILSASAESNLLAVVSVMAALSQEAHLRLLLSAFFVRVLSLVTPIRSFTELLRVSLHHCEVSLPRVSV